jgi:hypothetical protein
VFLPFDIGPYVARVPANSTTADLLSEEFIGDQGTIKPLKG